MATTSPADAAALDASVAAAPATPSAAPPTEPATKPSAPIAIGPAARKARIDSGENLPLAGPAESPLAKLGVPPAAVPIAATTVTVGAMALWPLLLKTLTGLLKAVFGSFLKTRAKKGQKIDKTQKAIHVMGFVVRPAELAALMFGALNYGNTLRWNIRAQSAADSAAQGLLTIQTQRWNAMNEALYAANVEEFRLRSILNSLLLSMNDSGPCATYIGRVRGRQ